MKIKDSIELFSLLEKNKIGPFLAKDFGNDRIKGNYAEDSKNQKISNSWRLSFEMKGTVPSWVSESAIITESSIKKGISSISSELFL